MITLTSSKPTSTVLRTYTGELRFQERGSNKRRYLQQKVSEIEYEGGKPKKSYTFFEDVPLVDESGAPRDAAMSSDKLSAVR